MEPVIDAAAVTGVPQPDPLLSPDPQVVPGALAPPGSAALPGAGPLSATRQTPGTLPLYDHFQQPLKKVFPAPASPRNS